MRARTFIVPVAAFCCLGLLAACSGGGAGLVVVPPAAEKTQAPVDKYKDVHAIYLYDIGYVHFNPVEIGNSQYPSYVFSEFVKIKLLTRAATEFQRYGNIRLTHLGDLFQIEALVIKPDGTSKKLAKNDIVTNVIIKDMIPDANSEINLNETTIIFPGLEPGDIISYNYTTRYHRGLSWSFSKRDAPVLFSKFMAARPMRRIEIQPMIYDRHGLTPERVEEKGMATGMQGRVGNRQATFDIWTAENVPPIKGEPSIQPTVELASRMRVWQGDRRWEWSVLGESYYKWFTHYGRKPGTAKELAVKVIAGIDEPRERARAIHDWVKQNLNIQDHDQLSWAPRVMEITTIDLDKLIKEKTATPEQAASLMWLMMDAASVDVSLVLTTSKFEPAAEEGLPDLYQFTYPLLQLADGTIVDTTNRLCPFGMVPWYFEGRKSLAIKGSTVAFKDLPTTGSAMNKSSLTVAGELSTEGEATVQVKRVLTGQLALEMRTFLTSLAEKEREKALQGWVNLAAAKAELGEFAINNLEKPAEPLEINVNYRVPNHAQVLQDKQVLKLDAFINLTRCPELVQEKRVNPVWFGHRWQEEMDVKIKLPLGYNLQALPKGFRTRQMDSGTAMGVQTSYGAPEPKTLHVIRKISVNETSVDLKGYPAMRKLVQTYLAQKDKLITLELPKMD